MKTEVGTAWWGGKCKKSREGRGARAEERFGNGTGRERRGGEVRAKG